MDFGFDSLTIATGMLIFFARIIDVSLGTIRTISIIRGRTWVAFWVGIVEISVWITVISTVVNKINDVPLLGVFFAFGFATGNLVGIHIERKLAMGHIIIRVISRDYYREMAETIRAKDFAVTVFQGEGKDGPVGELYIVCRRRHLGEILEMVRLIEPEAFYITEQVGSVSKIYRPMMQSATGWRAILKKK